MRGVPYVQICAYIGAAAGTGSTVCNISGSTVTPHTAMYNTLCWSRVLIGRTDRFNLLT